MSKRRFAGIFSLSVLLSFGTLLVATAGNNNSKPLDSESKQRAKDVGKGVLKEAAHKVIDKLPLGGDREAAKGVVDGVLSGNPVKAFLSASTESSTQTPEQDMPPTRVKSDTPVIPAHDGDLQPKPEVVHVAALPPVVPARNEFLDDDDFVMDAREAEKAENAQMQESAPTQLPPHADPNQQKPGFNDRSFIQREVTPAMPHDVGVTVIHDGHNGQGTGGGGGHMGGWAGGDHPTHGDTV